MDGCEILHHQFGMLKTLWIMGFLPPINWGSLARCAPSCRRAANSSTPGRSVKLWAQGWRSGKWMNMDEHGYGSIPINTIFRGMNIHLPAILMWTTGVQGFDTLPHDQSMDDWATEILIFHSHVLVYQKVYKYRNTSTNFGDPQLIRHWPS